MSLELINDRIALQDLMLNYAAAVDERDIERYRSCFAEDVLVVNFGDQNFQGRETWVDHVWAELEKFSSTQHLLGPQFAQVRGDQAETRSDVQALHYLVSSETSAENSEGITRFILWATYYTTMLRVDGDWKIARHELQVRGSSTE
ncbi:MAG: ketosteroid isomerase-like protein [Halioglobus sp.]|jgi:ketosteroid isomerase-like protein